MRKPRVLVTDGSYLHSLAVVRSLGSAGTDLVVAERESIPRLKWVAGWSRYCRGWRSYPDPNLNRQATADVLSHLCKLESFDAFIPVGLDLADIAVHYADQLQVPAMLPPVESFEIASDKRRTFELAKTLAVPIPKTVPATQYNAIELPCVFKHYRSGVFIANNEREAVDIASRLGDSIDDYLAQEYIPGINGYGYFGFFSQGEEVGFFMHERLIQYPMQGGPSVVAKSYYDPELREYGRRLLSALKWNGVAMVEFKMHPVSHSYHLMEINPKFWGSLDLAIAAGCNFPLWVRDYLLGREPQIPKSYDLNTMFQWIVPSGLKCLLHHPQYRSQFFSQILNRHLRSEVRLSDPLPTLAGLLSLVTRLRL